MNAPRGDLYVGSISGTSMDGIDLALLEDSNPPTIVAGRTAAFEPKLRDALSGLASGAKDDVDSLGAAHAALGDAIGAAVCDFLETLDIAPGQVRAIGSHGQTVRHRPDEPPAFTLQIGDPNRIAERTGIDTVADFRGRDIAAGGQGAPLVPPFHRALFARPGETRTILNIGGIANLTLLPEVGARQLEGFDTGPGNALLDAWIAHVRGERFDRDGAWSASGQVHAELLEALLADPYFERPPPKSTGKEHFNLDWLAGRDAGLAAADVQATLAQLTAETVARAVRKWGPDGGELIVCGGGRLNGDLMGRLAALLPDHTVLPSEQVGHQGDWIEAAAFAWLAARFIKREPGNAVEVTGAAGPRILGALYAG